MSPAVFVMCVLVLVISTLRSEAASICPEKLEPGDRVTRGRDWKWGNQGSNQLGTVRSQVTNGSGLFEVWWDDGSFNFYRYNNRDGIHDLRKVAKNFKNFPEPTAWPELTKGDTVIRYRDWSFGDQGSGTLGIISENQGNGWFQVAWGDGTDTSCQYSRSRGTFDIKLAAPLELVNAQYILRSNPCCTLKAGDVVEQGEDWEWIEHKIELPGVVLGRASSGGWLQVKWKNGLEKEYRCGFNGKFDLKYVSKKRLENYKPGSKLVRRDGKAQGLVLGHVGNWAMTLWADNKPLKLVHLHDGHDEFLDKTPIASLADRLLSTWSFGLSKTCAVEIDPALTRQHSEDPKKTVTVIVSFQGFSTQSLLSEHDRICNIQCRGGQSSLLPKMMQIRADLSQNYALRLLERSRTEYSSYFRLMTTNQIVVFDAKQSFVFDLAKTPNVTKVELDHPLGETSTGNVSKTHSRPSRALPEPASPEWNIQMIRANTVWEERQTAGEGIIVGVIDSGVNSHHSALAGKIIPDESSWFDAITNRDSPHDDDGHGTHVTATILGSHGYGVAPAARYISCKALKFDPSTRRSTGTASSMLLCLEFMFCPRRRTDHEFPAVCSRPHIINNSWGFSRDNVHRFPTHVPRIEEQLKALDHEKMVTVFAVGNEGKEGCRSTQYPSSGMNLATMITVGAVDNANRVFELSSRGPGHLESHPGYVFRPDIVAPGVQVRSAISGDGHDNDASAPLDGTSMAAPHVTGTIALWFSDPQVRLKDFAELTKDTVWQSGVATTSTGEHCSFRHDSRYGNHHVGYGRIDAMLAYTTDFRSVYGNAILKDPLNNGRFQWE